MQIDLWFDHWYTYQNAMAHKLTQYHTIRVLMNVATEICMQKMSKIFIISIVVVLYHHLFTTAR